MGPVKILLARGSSVGSHNQSLLTVWALDKTRIRRHRNVERTSILNNLLIISKKSCFTKCEWKQFKPSETSKEKTIKCLKWEIEFICIF